MNLRHLFFFLTALIFFESVQAEPWLSNKVTQNCAACHAPGRINKKPKDVRCTLSCQGCHVNPNGGGIRNFYGKWNQERWLKSVTTKKWTDKPLPLPTSRQTYAKALDLWLGDEHLDEKEDQEEEYSHRRSSRKRRSKRKPRRRKKVAQTEKNKKKLLRLRTMKEASDPFLSEKLFEDHENPRWKILSQDDAEFLSQVPVGDPYRMERSEPVVGGGDLRFLSLSIDRGDGAGKQNFTWTMSADLGVRWKPIEENLSLVLESRFLNAPQDGNIDDGFQTSQLRSGYVLVDDLPYNSHAMIGMYRPMFGHYNIDHEGLIPEITGLDQRAIFKGIGIGTAPNVPFANIHLLSPGSNTFVQQDSGFVINIGGRFVSYGLSPQASYWSTTKKDSNGDEIKKTMYSLSVGGRYKDFIGVFEILNIDEETAPGVSDKGSATWAELKYKAWRDVYLVLNYGQSNIARTRAEGSGTEMMLGVKSFLLTGMELEVLYVKRDDVVGTVETSSTSIQTQLHLFF